MGEEETESVAVGIDNLNIDTAGKEEEASEGLEVALRMEIGEEGEGEGEGEEGGDENQRALGDLEFLTQEADTSGTTLVDACNGFNELSRLVMLWTVWH